MSDFFHPKLQSVEALAPYQLRTTWSTGEVLDVDIESVLRSIPALANLLDPQVFGEVHLADWGAGIEWFDAELGADNVYAWAKEQAGEVSHQMFDTWMYRNGLSLNSAADALGISRRMVSYYRTAQKAIPRAIWLACLGWEATLPKPNTLPATCQQPVSTHWRMRDTRDRMPRVRRSRRRLCGSDIWVPKPVTTSCPAFALSR